ncbi:hypothetical protein TRVL_07862 [Trypanosoma vivax]|nr:hypothetical protein TRVL_07862 [Trypanosoma vivax]
MPQMGLMPSWLFLVTLCVEIKSNLRSCSSCSFSYPKAQSSSPCLSSALLLWRNPQICSLRIASVICNLFWSISHLVLRRFCVQLCTVSLQSASGMEVQEQSGLNAHCEVPPGLLCAFAHPAMQELLL